MPRPRTKPDDAISPAPVGEIVLVNIHPIEVRLRPAVIVEHSVFGVAADDWCSIGELLVLEKDMPLPFGVRAYTEKHIGVCVQVSPMNHGTGCGQWRHR